MGVRNDKERLGPRPRARTARVQHATLAHCDAAEHTDTGPFKHKVGASTACMQSEALHSTLIST
jgi:hypothetical protein